MISTVRITVGVYIPGIKSKYFAIEKKYVTLTHKSKYNK